MSERTTESGIPTHEVYRPGDVDGRSYDERLGDPGSFPFTRGARAGQSQRGWIQRELDVNLTGAFNMVQAVLGPMVERGWGRIVVISSGAATGGLHRQAAYAASKAGLLGLVKTVTLEHARHGITCNAILPGLIETENVAGMPAEIKEASRALTPARRLGRMEEVARVAAFLASEGAGFVNGAEIPVDGGARLGGISLGSRRELAEQFGGLFEALYGQRPGGTVS